MTPKASCLLFGLMLLAWSKAWSPGPAVPAPITGLSVDIGQRNDVLSFYQHVFKASENHASVLNWTGNHSTCNQGSLSQSYVDLMRRRLNYYRALAGVPATISLNTSSTVVTDGDPYGAPGTTTKTDAAQRSALLLSRSNTLTHNPTSGYPCYSTAAANGSYFGNIAIGFNGPPALEAYMRENAANAAAGHRRWMLYTRAVNFATGDIPRVGSYLASNSLYVRQRSNELVPSLNQFVAWPPAGYVPWRHFTEYWSLSYPGASFTSATVSVTKNGVAVPIHSINRTQGFGESGMVWRIDGLAESGPDTTYNVTVANISGSGVPTSYSYSFTFFNADNLQTPPALAGATSISPGGSATYTVSPVAIADAYRLEVGKISTLSTGVLEGGEDATSSFLIPGPVTGYNLRPSTAGYVRNGSKSINLAYTESGQTEQWVEMNRILIPKASSTIKFYRRIGYLSSNSTFVAQYCLNHDGIWTDIPGTTKVGTTALSASPSVTDSSFVEVTANLPAATIGVPTTFRFLIRKAPATEYITPSDGSTNYTGAFIDDISFTNADWLSSRTLTEYTAGIGSVTLNSSTAGESITAATTYTLRLQPRVASTWMTASSMLNVAAAYQAPTITAIPATIMVQNTSSPAIPFTIHDSDTSVASLTVTRASSNTTLLPVANIVLGGSGASRTVTLTPAANRTGTANVTITVSDGSLSASSVFTLTVNAQNSAPTITSISTQTISEDQSTSAIPFTIGDPEQLLNNLTVSASSGNTTLLPAGGIILAGSGTARTITLTPAANQSGTATVTITVNDGQSVNATASTTFTLQVNAVNDAPTISGIDNISINRNSNTGEIPFTIGDPDHSAASLTLSATSSNQALVPDSIILFSGSGGTRKVSINPTPQMTGQSTITLTVSDGSLTQSTAFVLTVTPPNLVGFEAWIADDYPELAESDFDDDYDGDSIPNGVEYAFSLDPTKPSKLGDLQINATNATMTLVMPLPAVRENVIYSAEHSDSQNSWHTTGVTVTIANGQITATCPMGTNSRFMRWKITKQ